MEIQALSPPPSLKPPAERKEKTEEKSPSLHQIYALLNAIQCQMQSLNRDYLDVVRKDLQRYKQDTKKHSGERNSQGWHTATLTCAGAMLMGLSPYVKSIGDLGPFEDLIESLGGADKVQKLCETGSQLADGSKPVFNVWSEGKIGEIETSKQLIQMAQRQGEEAARNTESMVEKLANTALRLYESDSRSKFS